MRKHLITPLLILGSLASSNLPAAETAKPAAMPVEMQQMMKTYSPELRQKVMAYPA